MKIKDGAIIAGLDLRMRKALIAADRIWKEYGQELTITCGLDGEHSAGSYHYYGLAVDCRIWNFTNEQLLMIIRDLKEELGPPYDIVLEKTHIHIEYDIGKDKSFYAVLLKALGIPK